MNLKLIRKENENCYLYGTIYNDLDYFCDTLEFGSNVCLPSGMYTLKLGVDKIRKIQLIEIYDLNSNRVANFEKDNLYFYHTIKMRYENANICLGTRILDPLLQMSSYVTTSLGMLIKTAEYHNEIVYFEIVTPEILKKTLKKVV